MGRILKYVHKKGFYYLQNLVTSITLKKNYLYLMHNIPIDRYICSKISVYYFKRLQ